MNENEVKKLYTALINKGFSANDIGDENTFVAKMGDQNSRKQFYDAISKTSFKIGDYDTFEKRLTSTSDSPLSQEERAGYLMQGIEGKRNTSGIVDDFSAFADNMREYGDKAPVSQNMEQPIESSRMFNPESGKMEKTFVTPSGSRYSNKNLADFEVSRYREAADMTVNGQLRRARAKLEELQAKKADRTSEVHDEAMEFNESKLTGLGQMLVGGDIYVAKQRGDSQKGALDVAIRQTEELIKDLEEQKDRDKGVDIGFWRGVGRTMGDSRTWDFGIGNMGDAITMLHSDKLADENATEGEKDAYNEMMSAIYNKEQADRMYGDNRDFWYKAGVTTGYMPSFMIDFIATGAGYKGLNLLSKGGAKAATKIVGKEISEEIAEKGFKQFVKDNGVKGFMQYGTDWTVKALGTMGDDLLVRAPMMANTVQFGKTASDIIDRKLGDVVVNEDGSYDFANDETWSSAIWQGEANAIVENFSEMFGGHLGQVVDLGKLGKLANVIGAKRLGNILTQADAGSLGGIMGQTQRLFNEMGVGDYFGEVTEEFYGQLWRTVLNLDDAYIQNPDGTRTNLFATSEFYGDVLGGMALSMGLMGAAKTTYTGAKYAYAKHNVNKADKRAAVLFGDEWEGIRATIDNTTNDNMGALIQSVLAENYSTKEMNAILSYMESSMVLRGFNLGTLARSRGEQNEVAQEVNESYLDGYNASTPQEMNDAQNMYDLKREKALSFFTETELETIANNPVAHIDAYSGEQRDVLLDYINAKQVRDGMIQRVRDDIDSRIEESNTMVDSRTNTDTGMIQGATMKVDDRKVYIIKGNLVQYDDKSGINNSASSESVIIRDAQTGKIEIVSPDAILNIDDAIDPNEEKATAAEVIRTTYAQAEADKMEGKLTFNPGDTYTLDTENGQMQVQITANEQGIVDNGDGTINVTDGQNIFPVTKQTFQDQVDAANKARVAQYDALQQAERSMENTPEYALNDKVVLRDANGNTINGQIAEVFADDGYYIVDVDVPINGSYAARMTRDELNNMLVEHNGVNVNTPSVPAQQAQSTPVAPAPSQQAQTPAAPQNNTALSRIPKDAQGNPIYEQTDADTAWDAIVEQTEGDEAMAQSVAESMLKDKQTALSKAEKMQVKGGVTIAEKIAAEKEHKAIIANAQREVELWQQIAGTVQRRQAAAEVQRKIEEEKRRIAEEAAAQQAKVEEEQPQAQTNQEELAVEDSEQEVADVASESEEKIDDSTIGEQITEQETPVQAEEQVQSEESPAESQVTERAETPTSAQPKESKNAKKLRKRAEKWMKDTGVTVRLLNSIDEVTNKSARAVIEAGNPVSGWFSNNEVVLYMPNINSVEEIDKTFIHEVVAHKGLRMLMGEKFDALCDNVWDMMSEEDRAKYIKYPGVKGNTRKAADEYMAYLAEGVDLNKTIWQKIIDAVKEFFSSKDVTLLDEEIANLIKESYKNLKAQTATNVDNEVASIDGNDAMFSIKTYREGGRDILQKFLKGRVKAKDLTKAEAEEMLNQMDDIYAICEEFKDKYAPFGNWSEAAVVVDEDGKPVFSVIKPNGDYAMNLDFSLVCKKRRTLDAVFREMINRGIISDYDLGQVDIAKINDIIRQYGFETACRLCFVDAKRFRVAMVADAFVGIYNPLTKMTDQQLQNVSKQMGDATEGKIARMLLKNPENRIQLSRDNFMDSKGFEDIKANKAEIMSLYNAKKGTGGPKAALGDVQYLNDILKKKWSPKTAYSVGGVRLQSFSDYVPRMVFDYIQMIADLAAKKLPVHSYTKEVLFAQTFGLTGMKINLSLVPKVVEGGLAPGLDAEGNYAWQEGETFPYEEAMKLQNAEGYKENCGTIAVGVSDEHIQKLLDDENIRMVIPYHKSGLNKQVAIHNNIDQFVDYTNEQNTRNADGKKLSEEQAKKHFNFNSDLQKHGNPRKAAENYLEWCRKNNYLPKFDKFQNNPNYYKLLEDFTTCITENGVDTFVPQGAVKMNFPTNESAFGSLSELIERGLEEDAILEGMKSEKIGSIVDDIQKALDEGQTMFRISEEQDKAYIDAVEAGDMETAQAMVDSAAQAAGYNSPRLYHGTKSEFNVFNAKHNDPGSKGFFFTDSEEMASSYGKNIKQVYLRVEDPYVIEGNGRNWNNLHTDIFSVIPEIEDQIRAHEIAMKRFLENGDIKQSQYDYFRDKYYDKVDFIKDESKNSIFDIIKKYIYRWQIRNFNSKLNVDRTRDFEWLLQQLDSDVNIIFKDITDYGANITDYESIFTPHDVYVTTNPKNIKSADAVTYDDNGNIIPLSERFNEDEDDIRFRSDFGNNSGYTQRDNGNRISRRAKEAESEGSFTAGTFRKMYGVSKKDFDILEELGVIKVTEWHHTGANFAKNNFYTWADSSRIAENGSDYSNGEIPQGSLAEKYKENKKEIAKLAKEYEESKWEYKPKTGKYIIPTIEQYAERMANEYSFEETPYLSESEKKQIAKEHQEISNSGKSSHERYIDHQSLENKTRKEIANRLLNNEELGLKERYESEVRPQREHNEQVEEYNQRVNEYNSNTNGKEKALLDIANLLGFEISQDVLESKSQINRRKERLAEAREKANAKLIEKNEAISQMESDLQKWVESQKKNGKIVVRERISEKDMPENFVIEKKEMKGRYGWFDATIRYNLPVYYSGLEFSSKRLHDSYMNKRKEIRETDIRLTDEYNDFYNEVFKSSQEDEGISFRIRQITDKERQTMINALSLSEGEEFYDNVFNGADQVVRENIVAIAAKNGWDFRKATEEYLGSLADNNPRFDEVKQIGLWDKVKGFFVDMLNKIGLNGFTKDSLADNDLRYILWRRFKNPKGRKDLFEKAEDIAKKYELGVGDYAVTNSNASQEEDILFRNGDPQVRERIRVRDRYERRVRSGLYQSKEAIQDSMLSLKEAMQMIAGKGKKYIEDIADYMNAYLGENRLSSVNQAEVNAFARTLFKPMLDVVARLAKTESERVKLIDYMFAKHGLERNAHMRQEALNNGDTNALNRDFAGLTALTGENNVADAEVHAQKMVDEYERTHNTAELWDKVNAISKSILSKSYECGLMSKEAYDKVSNMYQYYIPLRGFDEKTSTEEYAYLNNKEGAYNAAIRKAEGRTSKADDPFANLESMAESTIMAGNRNQLVKQKFYNFVQNNPSDLVSVSELWLEYDNVNDEWKPVFPDNININDTPQQVEQKLQAFEAKMEGLKQQYPDKYKHGKDAVGIPYRVITKSNLKEHQVVVKRNGRDIILTINGNPRLAQALNGMTNPDNDLSGAIGEVLRLGERLNRILSTNYTTRNPDFIVSNFLRDMLYSNIMVWIKESPKYALKFHRNYAKLNPAYMRMLYGKYRKGTLDMNNKTEAMFYQFIMNGGETGFSNIRDMEQHKKDIAKMLKKANGKLNASQAMDLLATQFDELNRSVENCARFAAFMTSREVGRTIGRSIYDAKEISVNFNKKGSGSKFYDKEGQTKLGNVAAMTSGLGRAGFAFWNASIQGTTNFGRQLKRHPAKAFTSLATMFILGAIVAYLGNDDDEDDKNAYYNIPENVRRSNIMFRAGDSWISIPLPIEFRAMYGMGELATTILSGKEHLTGGEIAEAITAQMSQILPLDFMEGDGGFDTFMPTILKPYWEVRHNKSWTGLPIFKDNDFNKNMPDWTKAYKNANKQLVNLAATLNEISGGDKYTKGAIDINPAKIEYLLNGYFGGIFSTIDKLTKTAETIAGDREYDPRSILLWNRVVKSGDERTDFRAINNEYYRVKEEVQDTKRRLNGYERDTGLGIFDYAEKIDFIYNSPEYERYEIFMDYNKDIKKLMEELKEAEDLGDKEWAKDIETELNYLKQEMLLVMEHTYDRK